MRRETIPRIGEGGGWPSTGAGSRRGRTGCCRGRRRGGAAAGPPRRVSGRCGTAPRLLLRLRLRMRGRPPLGAPSPAERRRPLQPSFLSVPLFFWGREPSFSKLLLPVASGSVWVLRGPDPRVYTSLLHQDPMADKLSVDFCVAKKSLTSTVGKYFAKKKYSRKML
jgi:hypothetical protein